MAQVFLSFSKNIVFISFLLIACEKKTLHAPLPQDPGLMTPLPSVGEITLPSGKKLKTWLAITQEEQTKGLSGTRNQDFSENESMLFFFTADSWRSFWMPDTYFDLDIFFLDKNLKILDIERNVKHHLGWSEKKVKIARTRNIWARHVLEIKSSSPMAKEIKNGDQLTWQGTLTLDQIELKIRQQR